MPPAPSLASSHRPGLRVATLVAAMIAAVVAVASLVILDQEREARAQLAAFADDQATLAESLAHGVDERLDGVDAAPNAVPRGFVASALAALAWVEQPSERVVLLVGADGAPRLASGTVADVPSIHRAVAAGERSVVVDREQASRLGLARRTAFAGIAEVSRAPLRVVVVTSAADERDREIRARTRVLLGIGLAVGLVSAFGGLAIRKQRRARALEHELELAELRAERDRRLEREGRAATLGTLAGGVAHEISTPLGVIVGRAEQLGPRVQGDDRAARCVAAILDQAERIREVVRTFLDLARGGSPSLVAASPASVMEGARALVEHRFATAGVALRVDASPGVAEVRCDPRLLEHALVNLLLNACDACPRGGRVELTARATESGVRFEVEDDGAGIAPDAAARATEPFFTTKPAGSGTGLGLAIVSEIVKYHRGAFAIGPAPSRGTRVEVTIPVAASDEGGGGDHGIG